MLAKKQNLAVRSEDAADTPGSSSRAVCPASPREQFEQVESGSDTAVQALPAVASEPAMAARGPVGQTLEQQIKDVRKQVERLVKRRGLP